MNKIEWDSALAIEMYKAPKVGRFDDKARDVRKNVYKNNFEVFEQWGYVASSGKEVSLSDKQKMLDATKVYREAFSVEGVPSVTDSTNKYLKDVGSVEAGKELLDRGFNPAVLNFADAYQACGMYNIGSNAQEESLCRVSTLSQTLYQYYNKLWSNKVEVVLRPQPAYPMDINFGGIYSKVTVFRDGPSSGFAFREEPFDIGIISVAALNLCHPRPGKKTITNHEYATEDKNNPLTEDGKLVMLNKIRTIYRIALDNEHDSLVLGAWGCGVFKHNPEQIAEMFLKILEEPEFKNKFKEVCFAVLGESNYNGFKKVIIDMQIG